MTCWWLWGLHPLRPLGLHASSVPLAAGALWWSSCFFPRPPSTPERSVFNRVMVQVFRSCHSQPLAPGLEASAVTEAAGRDPLSLLSPADLLLLKPWRLPLTHPPLLSFCLCSCPCPRYCPLKMALGSLSSPSSGIKLRGPFPSEASPRLKSPTTWGSLMSGPAAVSFHQLPAVWRALDCIPRALCWGRRAGV